MLKCVQLVWYEMTDGCTYVHVSAEEAVKGSGDNEHGETDFSAGKPKRQSEFGVCVLFVHTV